MIISFAWTTPALLSGHKTMTRRDWTHAHATRFTVGQLVDAWDRSPRTGTGRKVATIRITREPRRESTSTIRREDFRREGFTWLQDHGYHGQVEAVLRSWALDPREVWVVEFELVSVDRSAGVGRPIAGERQVEGSAPESDPSVHHAERDDLGRPRPISSRGDA